MGDSQFRTVSKSTIFGIISTFISINFSKHIMKKNCIIAFVLVGRPGRPGSRTSTKTHFFKLFFYIAYTSYDASGSPFVTQNLRESDCHFYILKSSLTESRVIVFFFTEVCRLPCIHLLLFLNPSSSECKQEMNSKYVHALRSLL